MKHGLTARNIVLDDEDPDELDELRARLEDELKPATIIEHEFIDDLAWSLWRRRRVRTVETNLIRAHQEQAEQEKEQSEQEWYVEEEAERRLREAIKDDEDQSPLDHSTRAIWFRQIVQDVKDEEQENPGSLVHLSHSRTPHQSKAKTGLGVLLWDSEGEAALDRVFRYETAITNGLMRTLNMLEHLQAQRRAAEQDERVIEAVVVSPPKLSKS